MHFPPVPQCDVKVLLLIFSPKKRAFVGLIPVEQVGISYVYVGLHYCMYMKTVWCLCVLGLTLLRVLVYHVGWIYISRVLHCHP